MLISFVLQVFTNQIPTISVSDTLGMEKDHKVSSEADSGWRILQKLLLPNKTNLTSGILWI